MNWIKVNNFRELPRDGRVFLAMWKGRICLTQYDEEDGEFYFMYDPAYYHGPSKSDLNHAHKFKYWMELPPEKFEDEKDLEQSQEPSTEEFNPDQYNAPWEKPLMSPDFLGDKTQKIGTMHNCGPGCCDPVQTKWPLRRELDIKCMDCGKNFFTGDVIHSTFGKNASWNESQQCEDCFDNKIKA